MRAALACLSTAVAAAVAVAACSIEPTRAGPDLPVAHDPEVITDVGHDLSRPLRELPVAPAPRPITRPLLRLPRPPSSASAVAVRSVAAAPVFAMPATAENFDGVGDGFSGPSGTFNVNSAPPDTVGDVGPNHYVQMVNAELAIFSKTGAVLYGPVPTNTIWSGFGGGCQTNDDGDGTVLYDPIADRWILSQFSVSTTPYLECVAVSQTADPTGAYYRYAFSYGNTDFPDYPKLGVWPDAYYVTYNVFANAATFSGARICALDRARMLTGAAATQQCFDTGSSIGGLLPADLDGSTQPPSGAPEIAVALGAGANQLATFRFAVDWSTPANTTFTGPATLATASFTEACSGGTCIPQSGTSQKLDSLADRLMHRLAYRNFGDHESLVVSHSVTAGASSGVRWYELRVAPATRALSIFQQGTYAPDSSWRWMPSVAMDKAGDVAVGFSLSSSSLHPEIHYTGRLSTDAAGQMTQGEGRIVDGAGSQSGSGLSRWGDYSSMNVDPSDDCTFWFTSEYEATTGAFNWHTRIASFSFPSCGATAATTGDFTISGSPSTQTVAPGSNAIYRIATATTAGTADTILLSTSSSLPSGSTASFSPATVTAGSASRLTIAVGAGAASGTYPITVTGTGTANAHATALTLVVNSPPVGAADAWDVAENVTLDVAAPGVLANDADAENEPLTAVLLTLPTHGALPSFGTNGSFRYGATVNYVGTDSFTYSAHDANGASPPVTVTITVHSTPVAVADSFVVTQNGTLTVSAPGILANDTDPESRPLTATLVSGPTHGSLALGADGSVSYTPVAGYFGSDSFAYSATDGVATSAPVAVSLDVGGVPVAGADAYTVAAGATFSAPAPGVLGNDSDADGDSLVVGSVTTAPTHGVLALATNGAFTYTPDAGYAGADSFAYTATDPSGFSSSPATVSLTVDAPPVAADDAYSVDQDTMLAVAAPALLANDSDPEGSPLSATLVTAPAHGVATVSSDGSFVYVPAAGYFGPDSFTYRASDAWGSADAIASIDVVHVNHAPVATDDAYALDEDGSLSAGVPAGVLANDSDPDGDAITAALVAAPAHGTVALAADGSFTYTPLPLFFGADAFTYQATDGTLSSATATVELTVHHVNHRPTAVADEYETEIDTALHVIPAKSVLGNDSDLDGDRLTAILDVQPAHGALALDSAGTFVYTPQEDLAGNDAFTYRVWDGVVLSSAAQVTIHVGGVDRPPAVPAPVSPRVGDVLPSATQHFEWKAADNDGESDALSYRLRVLKDGAVVKDVAASAALSLDLAGSSALPDGEYRWQIEAAEPNGLVSGPSAPVSFVVGGARAHGCQCSTSPGGSGAPAGSAAATGLIALGAIGAGGRRRVSASPRDR